jgi:hypothetical protein
MANFSRQVKRNQEKEQEKERMAKMYNKGFKDGTSMQFENDVQNIIGILTKLGTADGIGQKTAEKVRMFFLDELGQI